LNYVAQLKEAYNEWQESKGASSKKWLELMDEQVVFRSLAGGAEGMEFTKHCYSKADVEGYFDGLGADWEMLSYIPEYFVAEGDRVAVKSTCSWKSRKTNKVVETHKADFFRFSNDKIIEFFEFYDTAKAFEGAKPENAAPSSTKNTAP
jgi:uncharacterized protein